MSKKSFVKSLSNLSLDNNLQQLVASEREILAEIILFVREVDCRKMYLEFGYPSLFEYMTKRMGYSNASAQRRIDASRLTADVPEVLEHLESGDLNLSQISVMAQALRQVDKSSQKVGAETKEHLLTQLLGKDLSQTEVIVSEALNVPIKEASRARHQRDESVRFEVTLTKEQWEKFNQARDLLSTSLPNGSDWSKVIEDMSDAVISKKGKATSARARASKIAIFKGKNADLNSNQNSESNPNSNSNELKPLRTAIPKSVQREVFARDQCCQYQSKLTGQQCSSTWKLTLDHIKPVWAGGDNSPNNLRLFCASHNADVYRQQAGIRYV